jgi:hypothetical protein
MTKNNRFSPTKNPIFWHKSQCFEHFNLYNLNLFRLPQNFVFRGISCFHLWCPIGSISDFSMLYNSLPNMNLRQTTDYQLPITNYHGASSTISTLVERSLQINPFLTNKPNFPDTQMNVSNVITKNYEQLTMNNELKNKANSKPIQSQFKPNTKPIQTQNKPNSNPILARHAVWQGLSATSLAGWRQKNAVAFDD